MKYSHEHLVGFLVGALVVGILTLCLNMNTLCQITQTNKAVQKLHDGPQDKVYDEAIMWDALSQNFDAFNLVMRKHMVAKGYFLLQAIPGEAPYSFDLANGGRVTVFPPKATQ